MERAEKKAFDPAIEPNELMLKSLVSDEEVSGGAVPVTIPLTGLTVAVSNLLGVTSACTRSCWRP